jgi:hypothetical protein
MIKNSVLAPFVHSASSGVSAPIEDCSSNTLHSSLRAYSTLVLKIERTAFKILDYLTKNYC